MKIRHFVSGSSVILASWLLMTYLEEVPTHRYPTLGRGSVPIETGTETLQRSIPSSDSEGAVVMSVSQAPASSAAQ